MEKKFYELPELPYGYDALEPYISEEQLRIHHQKHHQAYVDGANNLLKRLDEARESKTGIDYKAIARELSFHVGGFLLHRFFWENMGPADENGGEPHGKIKDCIEKDFGDFERFKEEFSQTAVSTEGSGWAMLTYCPLTDRLLIVQVEKHNVNLIPQCKVLLALDVWEHAYYLDYKNLRPDYVEAFWNIINWDEVNNRIQALK